MTVTSQEPLSLPPINALYHGDVIDNISSDNGLVPDGTIA